VLRRCSACSSGLDGSIECRTIGSKVDWMTIAAPNASDREPSAALVLEQGRVIAKKYVLDRPAGFGGMAQLWVATNQATGAEVCVKLLVPEGREEEHDEEAVQRFRREAHAAASLTHRAIVRVFDLLELDARGDTVTRGGSPHAYAIVMELLRGETLGDLLAKRGTIPVEEALDLFLPILSALGHAHRASVIHRDLKPDNIFLATDPDGHVIPKVLDFGVSKLERADAITTDGVVIGTPCFMSPEQARGARRIDARSDVFSAGILLYMMLSGKNPFEDAQSFASVVDAILRREVVPLTELSPQIWAVIQRAIAKDPTKRWADATEMSIALRKACGRLTTTESEASLPAAFPRRLDTDSTTSGTLGANDSAGHAGPVADSSRAAARRRAIFAAIIGSAAAIAVFALITVFRPAGEDVASPASASAVTTSNVVTTPSVVVTTSAPAVPIAESGDSPPSSARTRARSAESTAPAVSAPSAFGATDRAAPRGAGGASRRSGSGAASVSPSAGRPIRKPGEEPHKARDPGF
jgi:eukaryotic-like serine/threonine-protein kinase